MSKQLAKKQDIPFLKGTYAADENGNIYSLERRGLDGRRVSAKRIKPLKTSNGYLFFQARSPSFSGPVLVHRAVLSAFTGELKPIDVNHKNGDKSDNRITNLEWVTRSENQLHAADLGLKRKGEASHLAKLTESQAIEILNLKFSGFTQKELSHIYGISQAQISRIQTGKKWRHIKTNQP